MNGTVGNFFQQKEHVASRVTDFFVPIYGVDDIPGSQWLIVLDSNVSCVKPDSVDDSQDRFLSRFF